MVDTADDDDVLPLHLGDEGQAVRDLQRRLVALGIDLDADAVGTFGDGTRSAVHEFQESRGLNGDGRCDRHTWAALVEAGFRLGDRLLYLRHPMLRGDDVAELQRGLGGLGFDAGRIDGIFGPDSERALREFQRNCGITTDGVCGPEVVAALTRLGKKVADGMEGAGMARVREQLRLRDAPRELQDRRIVVGEGGGLGALAGAVAHQLHRVGGRVFPLHHPDWSVQARQANDLGAEVFVGLEMGDEPVSVAYYATPGFESVGGRRLAEHLTGTLPTTALAATARGMRLPVLRETRMPAVLLHLGPPEAVVRSTAGIADAVCEGLRRWAEEPVDP